MPVAALILPLLISIAQTDEAQPSPVVVTGHLWAPFISPMGEPFRARTSEDDTLAKWFGQADRNGDGLLMSDEMQSDAERFFAALDSDGDGKIGPEEMRRYEWELAPDVQIMARTRPAPGESAQAARKDGRRRRGQAYGLEGGARYALLNLPQPVIAADSDFDRAVTRAEFRRAAVLRFRLLDTAGQGSLTLAQLQALLPAARMAGRKAKPKKNAPDTRIGNPLPPGD